jgi:nicotinate-nucleotide adenylyltransferase
MGRAPPKEPRATVRVGLFGGTFNPIHVGHLAVARAALDSLDLSGVVFIPAGDPPHKGAHDVASAAHRLAMVRLAVAGKPHFSVSDFEAQQPARKSYTIDSVRHCLAGEQ